MEWQVLSFTDLVPSDVNSPCLFELFFRTLVSESLFER